MSNPATHGLYLGAQVTYPGGVGFIEEIHKTGVAVSDGATANVTLLGFEEVTLVGAQPSSIEKPKNLVHALCLVRQLMGVVPKVYNEKLKFDVQPFDALVSRFNIACNACGVVMMASEISCETMPRHKEWKRQNEPPILYEAEPMVTVLMQFTFLWAEDPSQVLVSTMRGSATDPFADKAPIKAVSSAFKKMLLTVFAVSSGDEPEETGADAPYEKRQSRPTSQAKTEKRPEPESLGSLCLQAPQAVTDMCKKLGVTQVTQCREWIKANAAEYGRLDLEKAVKQFAETLQGGEKK